MLACGRLITPTVTSRCVASDSARMRKAADLPQPGAPVTRAKPPSPTSCWTRQQNDSRRVVTCSAVDGTAGANGFHLRPYSASILLFTHHLLRPWGGRLAATRLPPDARSNGRAAVRRRWLVWQRLVRPRPCSGTGANR